MRFLFTAIGFPPGDSGLYMCTQKTKNNNIHKEKQYVSQNTQNRKQHMQNKNMPHHNVNRLKRNKGRRT